MRNEFLELLSTAQITKASHQNKLRVLKKYYEQVSSEEFFEQLFSLLPKIFCKISIPIRNEYVERILDFLAEFIFLATPANDDDDEEDLTNDATHPLLTRVIVETLKYHCLANESVRYNSCLFIRLILQHIGYQISLDNELCDMIEEAMLQRTLDPKSSIRLQAVMALLRLQDPTNPDCPVIKAFVSLILDINASIRAEVVKTVAPCSTTVPQIVARLRDVDSNVRMAALRRCADLGPKSFKIIERQHIMKCGLSETQPKLKKVFLNNLLPKWLNAYGQDYIVFLTALKFDADETDIANTEDIMKEVMNLLLSSVPISNVISNLSLDEKKLIPLDRLSSEAVTLWKIIVSYLREHDDIDDYLDDILPELTPFCNYIKSIISEKMNKNMEDWEFLSYQHILHNLLEIVHGYDFSDEVGRKNVYDLSMKIIKEQDLQFKVKKKLISIAAQLSPKTEEFTSIICHIISDIREPLIEKIVETNSAVDTNIECQKAEMRVKIIMLSSELEDATDEQEFLKADGIKKDIDKLKMQLKEFDLPQRTVEVVKVTKDDPKTVCSCLDLLIALLELPSVQSLTPSLVAVKDEFIIPLLESNSAEVNWRILKCLALFCTLDENLAEQYVKIIGIPIFTYREIPNHSKLPLLVSVKAVSDLFRVYGANIFGGMEDTVNLTKQTNQPRRRLYRNDDTDENSTLTPSRFQLESIIEIILDMLDDENTEIRDTSVIAITKLILSNFPVTPLLITRIILKWYNPLTVKATDSLQQVLGILIGYYSKTIKGAREVIADAVIPILISIASAPVTSPLADVDVDNLLRFLAAITNSDDKVEHVNNHLNMAHMFCYEMMKTKNVSIVQYLSKMLLYLEIPCENNSSIKELIAQVEITLEEESPLEKIAKKNMSKFLQKLRSGLEEDTRVSALETINEENFNENSDLTNTNIGNNTKENDSTSPNGKLPNGELNDVINETTSDHGSNSEINVNNGDKGVMKRNVLDSLSEIGESNAINENQCSKNNKRTRAKSKHQKGTKSILENDSNETESSSCADSESEKTRSTRTSKRLRVCISPLNSVIDRARTNKVNKQYTKEKENDIIENIDLPSVNTDHPSKTNKGTNKNILRKQNKGLKINEKKINGGNEAKQPLRSKRRQGKVRSSSKKSDEESESSSEFDSEVRRISKRLKLDLNKNGSIRKDTVVISKSRREQSSQNAKGHESSNSSNISRRSSRVAKNNGTLKNVTSDDDTILHTILHEKSEGSVVHDLSSFSSLNERSASQRSLRSSTSSIGNRSTSNSGDNSPILEQRSKNNRKFSVVNSLTAKNKCLRSPTRKSKRRK